MIFNCNGSAQRSIENERFRRMINFKVLKNNGVQFWHVF